MIDALKPVDSINSRNPITMEGSEFLFRSVGGEIQSLYKELETLTEYSNSLLTEHSHTYNCKRWRILLTTTHRYNVLV